jgi:hypothetical protein
MTSIDLTKAEIDTLLGWGGTYDQERNFKNEDEELYAKLQSLLNKEFINVQQ